MEPSREEPTLPVSSYDPDEHPPTRQVQMVAFDPRWLRRALLAVFVAFVVYRIVEWSWTSLASFVFDLLLAWLLAISFDPIVTWLSRHGWRRGPATALVAGVVTLLSVAFLAAFGGVLATQLAELVTGLPTLVTNVVDWVNQRFHTNYDPTRLTEALNLSSDQVTSIVGNLAGGVLGVITSVVGFFFSLITVAVFSFYFSADSPRIKRTIASWLPPRQQLVFINVWDIAVTKAGGFVLSKIALATLSAVFHCGFFYLIGVPYWLPMGIFAGVVSQFIPTIGTYIGVALPALFAAFEDPLDVVWIILFATVYQQIENYWFTPKISTRTMDINSGVALAAVFIGAALFGPIGAIIGIPLVAIVIAVVEAYGQRYGLSRELVERAAQSGVAVTREEAESVGMHPGQLDLLEESPPTTRDGRENPGDDL